MVSPRKWKYSATMLAFQAPPEAVTRQLLPDMLSTCPIRNDSQIGRVPASCRESWRPHALTNGNDAVVTDRNGGDVWVHTHCVPGLPAFASSTMQFNKAPGQIDCTRQAEHAKNIGSNQEAPRCVP